MQDRIPTKPNRYAVYDDAHNFVRYEYHERADEPTQTGDALNKANLLPDALCTSLGIATTSLPKDALAALYALADSKAQIEFGSYEGTGTNSTSITFSKPPKMVIVAGANSASSENMGIWIDNITRSNLSTTQGMAKSWTLDGNTLAFNASSAGYALNTSGSAYFYIGAC